jgi:glycopeptide antibiotics resistance protein
MSIQHSRQAGSKSLLLADRITTALLNIYLIVLIWVVLFKLGVRFSYMEHREVNLIPFLGSFTPEGKLDVMEILLNVMIFIPLGVYTGMLFRKWLFGQKMLFFFGISFLLEGLQFILAIGAFDSTDLITNVSGGITGLFLVGALEKLFVNSVKAQKFVNILAAALTVVILILLILLKLNRLPIRYQ